VKISLRPTLWALVGVLVALLVIGQALCLVAILAQGDGTAESAEAAKETAARIADCTEPTGKCYQRGQKRTAETVGVLTESTRRVVAAALSCQADHITELQALIECIVERTPR
jgi:hypothetical protein